MFVMYIFSLDDAVCTSIVWLFTKSLLMFSNSFAIMLFLHSIAVPPFECSFVAGVNAAT